MVVPVQHLAHDVFPAAHQGAGCLEAHPADPFRISRQRPDPGRKGLETVRDHESVVVIAQDGRRRRRLQHDGGGVQGGRLLDHDAVRVVQGREQEEVRRGVILLQGLPVLDDAGEGHPVLQPFLADQLLHVGGRIAGSDEEHPETDVLQLLQRVDDHADVLLPDVLPHEEEGEFVRGDPQPVAGIGKEGVGIVGDQVAAVHHHFHRSLVAVFPEDVDDGFLGNPDLIGTLVELDDELDGLVHQHVGRNDPGKVLPVLAVERRDERDVPERGDVRGDPAGDEGGMGVDDLERPLDDLSEEGRVHFADPGYVRFPERNRDGKIVQDLEVIL